jgi:hypothetical protein
VTQLVRLAHQRWAIEQQYQELKPTFPIWLPRIGHILHLLALFCANVLVAGVTPNEPTTAT